MMIGCRQLTPEREESRLGEESLEEGSDDNEYGEIGLANGDTPKSPGIMRDRALVDTDFGTLLMAHCLSVVSVLGVLRKVAVSQGGLQLSGLSTPSPLEGT